MKALLKLYDGSEVYASESIISPSTRRAEFLVGCEWITDADVQNVVWIFSDKKPKQQQPTIKAKGWLK
jgi:hypothetical protein